MKRTHKIHVVTDHGCAFKTRHQPDTLAGCTMDCRCGVELIFPPEVRQLHPAVRVVRARDFHKYLSEESGGDWPADGTGTGWIEIGTTDGGGVVFFRPDARTEPAI